jgi:hypothetical protein
LLIGLIASCGKDPEPQFKIIETKEYTTNAIFNMRMNELWDRHIKTRQKLSDDQGKAIYNQFSDKIWELGKLELGKMSSTAAGICVVMKVDQYLLLCNFYYDPKDGGRYIANRNFFNY